MVEMAEERQIGDDQPIEEGKRMEMGEKKRRVVDLELDVFSTT